MAAKEKGLLVSVLRGEVDCTNGGVTSKYTQFILIGEDVPEIFTPDEQTPALYLKSRMLGGESFLWAATKQNAFSGASFGGNFVYTSDSRFPNAYPISVHDRFEVQS